MPRSSRKSTAESVSHLKQNAVPTAAQPVPTLTPGVSLRQLAHELNSLLDGSMRCVGMARTSLQSTTPSNTIAIEDGLGKAHAAMKHMAALLERAMKAGPAQSPAAAIAMFDEHQSMQELFAELAALQQPHAQQAGAEVSFSLPSDCVNVPAGPLGPVLMNGLRNAIEACAVIADAHIAPHNARSKNVAVTVMRPDDQTLDMRITGPAANKPVGQRMGLALSEQIVRELGGELALTAADGRTTLRICVPVASLCDHA